METRGNRKKISHTQKSRGKQSIDARRNDRLNEVYRMNQQSARMHRETLQERAEKNRRKREEEEQRLRKQRLYLLEQGRKVPEKKEASKKKKGQRESFQNWYARASSVQGVQNHADRVILQLTLLFLAIGLIMVLSASSYRALMEHSDAYYFFKRQFAFAIIGLIAMLILSVVNVEWIKRFSFPAAIVVIILLLLVFLIGDEALGAKRWIQIGSIRFSPADLAKPIGVVYFARFLEMQGKTLTQLNGFAVAAGVMMIYPVIIVVEDLGTALALFATLFAMLVVAGAPRNYLGGTFLLGLAGVGMAILAQPYRMARMVGFLDPFAPENMQGEGWQLVQSLYALGSGGLFGTGLGNSGQKMMYLPEMHTDFIFSVICEELGFIGGFLVFSLFVVFVWRGYWLAMRIEDPFKSLCCFGLVTVIGVQAFINIGVAVGVLPITGITLPFISYGGTSLAVSLATVGFILNLSRYAEPRGKKKRKNDLYRRA